jgi:hypothetical protein
MADNITEVPVEEQQTEQPTISAEVAQMMELSLNGGVPQKVEEAQPIIENEQSVVQPTFSFDILKDRFGYEKEEDVIKEIEELRTFKSNPSPAEIKFEKETDKKLFEALKAGKTDEVYSYLEEQRKLDRLTTTEVTKDTAKDIVKLGMQIRYKDLTQDEIDYKFNKQYGIPNKPIQGELEEDTEYEERVNNWKSQVTDKEMELMIEAKLARPELETAKSKLVLPDIQETNNPELNAFKQYQNDMIEAQKTGEIAKAEFSSFTPKQFEFKLPFKDEANKIEFDFSFEPDSGSFNNAVEMAIDNDKYFSTYFDKDGNPNRKQYLEDIYFAKNKENIIMAAIAQGKNAAIKAMLPDNSQGGLNRQIPQTQEMSDFDKQMQMSLDPFSKR